MSIRFALTNFATKAFYRASLIVKSYDFLSGERFVSTRDVLSREGYPVNASVGDLFIDKKTGMTLYAERFVDPVISREDGEIVEKLECVLFGIYVLSDDAALGKGMLLEDGIKRFLSNPTTPEQIEAADALFEHIRDCYETAEYGEFQDMTGRTVSNEGTVRRDEEFLKMAFGRA